MKRTLRHPLIIVGFLAGVVVLAVAAAAPAVTISRIHVEPGPLTTRLVLEADAALPVERTYYAAGAPDTIVIDVARAKAPALPLLAAADRQLIRDVSVEETGPDGLRFLVKLQERVPYRIFASDGRTVLELNRIQRTKGTYVMDADLRARLESGPRAELRLDRLDIDEAPDRVSFRARLDGEALAQVFALENPTRLVVDLFDTVYGARTSVYPVGKMGVEKVRVGQFQAGDPRAITRLVFDLKEPGYYALDSGRNELTVSFFASLPAPVAAPAPARTESRPEPARLEPEPLKPDTAEVKPIVSAPPVAKETPKPERRVSAAPAAAPPLAKEAPAQETQTPPPAGQGQQDKFKPKTITSEEEPYSGEIVSLKFKDADLRDVVLYLAEFADLNVVFDPDVKGIVTCNLADVPWDQALDIILRNNKMGKTIEGNVLRIAPMGTLTKEDEEDRRMKESKELAGPLMVKTVTLSYSKAKDVAALLTNKKSSRGEIVVDDRTNTLIISEVRDKLEVLEKLITVLDTPTPQVSIEARIVEATSTFVRNLGIQWGARGIADPYYGNQTSLQFPSKVLVDGAMIPQGIVTKGIGGPLGGYAVNLPAPAFSAALGFSFANVLDTFRLDMALTALETSGNGRIISSPKISTQNNQPAEIIQGRQIPVQTVANFTVTTRYVNAALELKATPQITAEGTIIMTVELQNNAADFANLVNGIPPITTQSAKTTVMIPDGGTTVIGGIYRTEDSITRERVPLLHQIPILGNIFRSFARTKQTRELLIFITPRILK